MKSASTALAIWETAHDVMSWNVEAAVHRLGTDSDLAAVLATMHREVKVEMPVCMDDGSLTVFVGYRVEHSTVRGPAFGETRFHPAVEPEQMRALASASTWKAAVANIPFGGAQGGVVCDPATLSSRELEKLTRKYVRQIGPLLGPYTGILALDRTCGAEAAGWAFDEYSSMYGAHPASIAGKPVEDGGTIGHESAAGQGIAIALRETAAFLGLELAGLRVVIQGLGDIGWWTGLAISDLGCRIVAVGDLARAVYAENGIDLHAAVAHGIGFGSAKGIAGAKTISLDDMLACDCDVFIAAARECSITGTIASRMKARVVVEGASLACTPTADMTFARRGITLVPDLVANCGSMVSAYSEWEQNLQQVCWNEQQVRSKLEETVVRAFKCVKERAGQDRSSLREAAYCVALERVARAEKLRII